ncbi:F0F1-type ATP synthase membrane subunit b/b' [Zhongshania antarctica]|jgi:F0F1-type ATP synthase membrane subunit b/b'|uniref:F0F1-type ATP synthase membrane subunit b/b n=1 Tax=Zhongshania antarctica TaxID=641702 RepID=A0A840R7B8_9GAMM|nr:hypothetical protein [Zhongshania antarctica]MBB5188428.1 F0F1-type ATP synthase membrane subunit b/b' [Zhongshania antarctica]
MKLSSGEILAGCIVLVLLVFEVWQYLDAKAYRETMNAQLVLLSTRVDSVDERVQQARDKLEELEQSSLGGLIENANDALIQGWSAMIDTVEKELHRAKKGFDKPAGNAGAGTDPQTDQSSMSAPNGNGPL